MLPHLAYMLMRLLPTNKSVSQPIWITFSWACLPSASACKLAHALSTWTKVNLSGLIHYRCSCWKSCSVLSGSPALTYFASFLFCTKMFSCTVPGAITAISASTHAGVQWSSIQMPTCLLMSKIRIPCIHLPLQLQTECLIACPDQVLKTTRMLTDFLQPVNGGRHLPSLSCDPTIGKDLKRIPSKVSLSGL